MLKELLVAVVSPLLVAVKVSPVPTVLILQPANVATPEEAPNGLVLQVSVPLPVPMANWIEAELLVTVFPPASSTVTAGCTVHAVAAVPPPGCVVKANCAAVPTVILNALLVAEVSPLLVAVSV
jgi:hypothetical protein